MHWAQPLNPVSLGLHLAQSLALAWASSRVAGSSWLALALLDGGFCFWRWLLLAGLGLAGAWLEWVWRWGGLICHLAFLELLEEAVAQ